MPIAKSLAMGGSWASSIVTADVGTSPAPPREEDNRDAFEDRPRPSLASAETVARGRNRDSGRGRSRGGPAASWPGGSLGTSSRRPGGPYGRSSSSPDASSRSSRSSRGAGAAAASWRGGSFGTSSRGGSFGASSRRPGGPFGRSHSSLLDASLRSGASQRRGAHTPPQIVRHASFGRDCGPPPEEDSLAGLGPFRRACGRVVDSEYAQLFMLALITVNAAMMGIATTPAVTDDPRMSRIFDVVDLIVLVIFTAESALQVAFHGPRGFCRDGWLVLDLFIVILSWLSLDLVTLQGFRIFRALRFVTHVAILRNLVTAIVGIVPSIAAIFMLLGLIFYIFAVMCTTLFKDYYVLGYTEQDYFGSLQLTLFTLFQFLCLDEWSAVAMEVTKHTYWAWAVFIAFILMSAFVVINLLIAVICDALQILRIAEEGLREQRATPDPHGWGEDPAEGWAMAEGFDVDGEFMSNVMLRQRVDELQGMLDEMIVVQEHMGRAIRRLSMAMGERIEQRPEGSGGAGKGMADGWVCTVEPAAMQRAHL